MFVIVLKDFGYVEILELIYLFDIKNRVGKGIFFCYFYYYYI